MGSTVQHAPQRASSDLVDTLAEHAEIIDSELRELARKGFDPIVIPDINWTDPQMRQRLWLLQVATRMAGQSKEELGAFLDSVAEEGGAPALQNWSDAIDDAGEFFVACADLLKALHARSLIAGAANARA
jgi:hypothetical protein